MSLSNDLPKEMQLHSVEAAQEAIEKAQKNVDIALRTLNVAKKAYIDEWARINEGLSSAELVDFLENDVLWMHPNPTCTAASFLDYLNEKLAFEKQALAFEKQALARKEEAAAAAIVVGMQNLTIPKDSPKSAVDSLGNRLRLKVEPQRASAFTSSSKSKIESAGMNGNFVAKLAPKIVRDATSTIIDEIQIISSVPLVKDGLFFSMFCKKVAETEESTRRNVDTTLSILFSQFFKTTYTANTQQRKYKLKDLNAKYGLASKGSSPDFVHTTTVNGDRMYGLAVIEFKDTASAPFDQIGQAFVSGCNIILSHVGLGLKSSECAVPLVMTNGNLYQFAWVTLLEPSFPVLHITSGILDASVPDTSRQIAIQLLRIRSFCCVMEQRLHTIISQSPSQSHETQLELDLGIYHTKNVDDVFLRWPTDTDRSFGYMWRVYDRLDGLIVAVLPLCVANLNEGDSLPRRQVVIFPRLESGFAMGVPSDRQLFDQYLVKLEEAIGKIHAAGVIHVDLYPSNILWRSVDGEIVVRIVDWDAATLLGDSFTETMRNRLSDSENSAYYWKNQGAAEPKCDYWFLFIMSNLNDDERLAMKGGVTEVNTVFKTSVERQRAKDGDLNVDFGIWCGRKYTSIE